MITGIALLGVVTAGLAPWFVERLSEAQAAEERTESEVSDLAAEVRALRAEVRALRHEDAPSRGRVPPPA
jgi:voltage-gated potassium channel